MISKEVIFSKEDAIHAVGEFIKYSEKLKRKVYIEAGENYDEYRVCGKSLLGILSLDLSKPVRIKVHEEDADFLNNLPYGCEELIKEDESFVLFYKENEENGIASNWYESKFTIDGKEFNCVEQYMMYMKAITFKDCIIAEEILKETIPSRIRRLGRHVQNYDDTTWSEVRYNYVKQGVKAKFEQNSNLKEWLMLTGNSTLVEASPTDKIWGVGLSVNNPDITNRAKWKGTNLLGKALMQVREEMFSKQ